MRARFANVSRPTPHDATHASARAKLAPKPRSRGVDRRLLGSRGREACDDCLRRIGIGNGDDSCPLSILNPTESNTQHHRSKTIGKSTHASTSSTMTTTEEPPDLDDAEPVPGERRASTPPPPGRLPGRRLSRSDGVQHEAQVSRFALPRSQPGRRPRASSADAIDPPSPLELTSRMENLGVHSAPRKRPPRQGELGRVDPKGRRPSSEEGGVGGGDGGVAPAGARGGPAPAAPEPRGS
ncbi:hypothetical protein ACHAWF_014116 [Thalassiosira exigua]